MPRPALAAALAAIALALAGCPRSAATPPALSNTPAPAAPSDDAAAGTLRLEGQVLDDQVDPLPGAHVWLSTRPLRTTVSEADGYFAFDHVAAGPYTVIARTDDGRAAHADVELTLASEPVILRLR